MNRNSIIKLNSRQNYKRPQYIEKPPPSIKYVPDRLFYLARLMYSNKCSNCYQNPLLNSTHLK